MEARALHLPLSPPEAPLGRKQQHGARGSGPVVDLGASKGFLPMNRWPWKCFPPWPALLLLLHRNLVLRTHQPARVGQTPRVRETGRESRRMLRVAV